MADKGIEIAGEIGESAGGIIMDEPTGELAPPILDDKPEEGGEEKPISVLKGVPKKIPIPAAVVKPPLRFEGLLLSQLTGYPGWIYTEEDLEEIAQLVRECGFEASPFILLMTAMAGIHGAKLAGFMAWKKAGRPGDLRKEG